MADYQQALQELIRQRQLAQPKPEDIAAAEEQNRLGLLLNNLFKSQASMGNIGGKPTESTGVDFQDYGKLASDQVKQKNLLANQQFEQGLQMQGAGMQADKFAQDQQAQQAQLARQPILEARVLQEQKLKDALMQSQTQEHTAKAAELYNKAKGGDSEASKDYMEAIKLEKLRQSLSSIKDPAVRRAAEQTLAAADAKAAKITQEMMPKDTQTTAATYATRAEQSNKNLEKITTDQFDPTALSSIVTGNALYPNALKGEGQQLSEQARRDFINAVLRRESGAVISDSEFENARKQYFTQPGDTSAVQKQKAENRRMTIAGLKAAAGTKALENIQKQSTNSKPKSIQQNGHTYILNESTGQYE